MSTGTEVNPGTETSTRELLKQALRKKEACRNMIKGLGALGTQAEAVFAAGLNSPDDGTRSICAQLLEKYGTASRALRPLRDQLDHSNDPRVQLAAADAILDILNRRWQEESPWRQTAAHHPGDKP